MLRNVQWINHALEILPYQRELLIKLGQYWTDKRGMFAYAGDPLTYDQRGQVTLLEINNKIMEIRKMYEDA